MISLNMIRCHIVDQPLVCVKSQHHPSPLVASIAYNHQQQDKRDDNDDNVCAEDDVRFDGNGICFGRISGNRGNIERLGVGESNHMQVNVEYKVEDRNNHTNDNNLATSTTTTTTIHDDHSTTSRVQRPMAICSKNVRCRPMLPSFNAGT